MEEPSKNVDEDALIHFKENVTRDIQGRYTVALPWLPDHPILLDNREIAETRLKRMTEKLWQNRLVERYQSVLEEWQDLGIIEVVPAEEMEKPCHYLAHRPVIKMSSETTKVRPVFDASCHREGFPSLNDCLNKGPNLLELIIPLLIKFRINRFGLVADIEKAFLQIGVAERDRDFLRFLWWRKGKMKEDLIVYRHKRLVFGVCCSPFLLSATIAHHLSGYETNDLKIREIVDKLASSLYVDDCVVSVESMNDLRMFVSESEKIMSSACFNLRGWIYNDSEKGDYVDGKETSVLGLLWNLQEDTLRCALKSSEIKLEKPFTKRGLLSLTNKIFDPLGILSPVTIVLKLLMQEVWKLKLFWDEEMPTEIADKLISWIRHWPSLEKCRVPRWVFQETVDWKRTSMHVFCDASSAAYAACIFLRSEGRQRVNVQLLLAKSRVAPLKEITIPRLELLGALIGTRLAVTVSKALPVKIPTTFWTDSSVVLSWIRRKEQWNVFVRNRIDEIRRNTEIENWRHVPGDLNPADLLSRGCNATRLLERSWWNGPKWLAMESVKWPQEEGIADETEILSERKKNICLAVIQSGSLMDFFTRYFSKYNKIVRMCAWMLRWTRRLKLLVEFRRIDSIDRKTDIQLKLQELTGELSNEETASAEVRLLKLMQDENLNMNERRIFGGLKLYRDEEGLVRLQSRLTEGLDGDHFQRPIVLREHELVRRLIRGKHISLGHAGVLTTLSQLRERFFIIGGRRLVRQIVKSCVVCKRVAGKPYVIQEPPLPLERIARVAAFQVTGVDLGGPLFLRKGGKIWFAVFTCAVYRAVHLELVSQLSTEAFIMALRRFIARRGRVTVMYSDRGTNFVGTNNFLSRLDWDRLKREGTKLEV